MRFRHQRSLVHPKLLLIRHGQSQLNDQGWGQSQQDSAICSLAPHLLETLKLLAHR